MRFTKPSARKAATTSLVSPSSAADTEDEPVRWSDVAASRKSTHPDVAPFKRVLDIFELCEHVLEYVPPKELLGMKRVCRSMNGVITKSPTLQTKLFFRAVPASTPWVVDASHSLLAGAKAVDTIRERDITGIAVQSARAYAYNPFTLSMREHDREAGLIYRFLSYIRSGTVCYDYIYLEHHMKSKLHTISEVASCRSMFVSQPSATKVVVEFYGRCEFPPWEDRRGLPKWYRGCVSRPTITNDSGVIVGEVLDVIRRETRGGDASFQHLCFTEGFAVSMEQKVFVEETAAVTRDTDPWDKHFKAE
ncbi:hypothetical protein LTR36_008530 [Oleoguttula mirabilis]|uniref:F-box domain-containing protein n=1 Tax=Oleoguttula mirabilis TaxID=1507867 RepID=A0AAV9JT04_9PEZI|nr:hypothetical protein LTR36_008530 [Oleoguttula mirabilis]